MNERDPHTTIDERGRNAATALHDLLEAEGAVADTGTGDPSVVAFRPRRSPMPYLLAAAAAIVVVVGFVVFATGDDGPTPVASDPSTYLLPSVPPLGLEAIGGSDDLEASTAAGGFLVEGDVAVYAGDANMQAPALAVMVLNGPDISTDEREGETVQVQGSDAILSTDGQTSIGGEGSAVTWVRPEGVVIVTGIDVTREQILAAAEATEFDGGRPTVPTEALPAGFSLQHRDGVNALVPFGTAYALEGGGAGVVAFSDDSQSSVIIMSTGPGDQRRVDAVGPFLTDARTVAVRSTEGVVGAPFPDSLTLTWLEADNTVVRLLAYGNVTEDDLLAMAESLAPVSAAEFSRVVTDATESSASADIPADAALTVEVDGGTLYVVIDEAGDSLEVGLQTTSGSSASGTSWSEFENGSPVVSFDEGSQVYGVVGDHVVRAVLLDAGVSTEVELIDVPGHPARAFFVSVGSNGPTIIDFYDAAGNVVGQGG